MEQRSTFSVHFYLKKHRANGNGELPIYLRISVNTDRAELSMHSTIAESSWDNRSGRAIGTTKKSRDINAFLESTRSTIFEHYKYMREVGAELTANSIRNSFLGIKEEKPRKTVLELYQEHNEKIKKLINIDYSYETIKRYGTSLNHTRNFIKHKYKKDDLYFTDLNYEFVADYEMYFKTVRNCSHNTALKYIKNFKKIVNLAISIGEINSDPFAGYKLRFKKVDRGFLSEVELNSLIKKKFSIKRLEQVRDCFLFGCFTGLAHADLKSLSPKNIVIGTDGCKWIKINRQKTDIQSSIPVLDVTQQLIDKYKNDPYCQLHNVILPVASNQKMNAYLKEIADLCGIKQQLTSHLARHTFATTVTLNNDVPIETVSKMLGHSSINMTKIYARLLDKKVGKDMKHLNKTYVLEDA